MTYLAAVVDSNTGYTTPPLGAESDTEEGRDDDNSGGSGDAEPSRRSIKNALSGVRENVKIYMFTILQSSFFLRAFSPFCVHWRSFLERMSPREVTISAAKIVSYYKYELATGEQF